MSIVVYIQTRESNTNRLGESDENEFEEIPV